MKSDMGKRLRLARKNKHLTQEELANQVGTTHKTIWDYEHGHRGAMRPNIHLIIKICEVLDISIGWLLTGN